MLIVQVNVVVMLLLMVAAFVMVKEELLNVGMVLMLVMIQSVQKNL